MELSALQNEYNILEDENSRLVSTVNTLLAERKRLAVLVDEKESGFQNKMSALVAEKAIGVVNTWSTNNGSNNQLEHKQRERKDSLKDELRETQLARLSKELEIEKQERVRTRKLCEQVLDIHITNERCGEEEYKSMASLLRNSSGYNGVRNNERNLEQQFDVECKDTMFDETARKSPQFDVECKDTMFDETARKSPQAKWDESVRQVAVQQEREIIKLKTALSTCNGTVTEQSNKLQSITEERNALKTQVELLKQELEKEVRNGVTNRAQIAEQLKSIHDLTMEIEQLKQAIQEKNALLTKAMREFSVAVPFKHDDGETYATSGDVIAAVHNQAQQENRQLSDQNHQLKLALGASSCRHANTIGQLQQLRSAAAMLKVECGEVKHVAQVTKSKYTAEIKQMFAIVNDKIAMRISRQQIETSGTEIPSCLHPHVKTSVTTGRQNDRNTNLKATTAQSDSGPSVLGIGSTIENNDGTSEPESHLLNKVGGNACIAIESKSSDNTMTRSSVVVGEAKLSLEVHRKQSPRNRHRRSATVDSPALSSFDWSRRIEPHTRGRALTVGANRAQMALAKSPLFSNLTGTEVQEIVKRCTVEEWRAGQTLPTGVMKGSGSVRFIVKGRVGIETEVGGLTFRCAGAVLGGFPGSKSETHLKSAVAVEPVRCLRFNKTEYDELCEQQKTSPIGRSLSKLASEIGLVDDALQATLQYGNGD